MKRLYLLFIAALQFTSQSQTTLDSGLVACYSFNGNASDPISSLSGTAVNVSPDINRNNFANYCLNFACNAGAYVQLPDNPLLKAQQVSFSAWIRPTTGFAGKAYILFTGQSGTFTPAYAVTLETSGAIKAIKLSKGSTVLQSTQMLNSNTWYHVGCTFSNNQLAYYLNGVLQSTIATSGAINYGAGKMVFIGTNNEPGSIETFCGRMDNVRFYNRILSSSEFAQLYANDPACVTVTAAPVANFTVFPPACVNQPMQFTNLSTNYPDAFSWQISNAVLSNSLISDPIITFTSSGTFSAALSVSNALGTSSILTNFTIHPKPNVIASSNRTTTCRGLGATLTGSGAQTYTWSTGVPQATVFVDPLKTTQYTVTGTDSLGCFNTATITIRLATDCLMGVKDVSDSPSVLIFPNPCNTSFWIHCETGKVRGAKIIDALGKELYVPIFEDGNKLRFDVSTLERGLYMLTLDVERKVVTKKLVLE